MRRWRRLAGLCVLVSWACDGSPSTPRQPLRAAFGLDARPANLTCMAPPRPPPSLAVAFTRVFAGVHLENSVVLAQPPGDRSRWYVAERMGPDGGDARVVAFDVAAPAA